MDTLIQQKYQSYSRGPLRICSAIGSPIMFILHMSSLTKQIWSSLAEICMLIFFCLWIASQYNVLGKIYILYHNNLNYAKLGFSLRDYISQKYSSLTNKADYGTVIKDQILGAEVETSKMNCCVKVSSCSCK